ncbi:acyl-CoA N-acyltransferase [Hypoxylon sp. FL1284]|nr:acyl-CoA N-acyltransferase [Hypoxylon sp. FL1284]
MASPWDFVETTLPCVPFPSTAKRNPIKTERLVIRPLEEDDLIALHQLRSQPEAMTGITRGRPDRDIAESRSALRGFLAPNDETTFLFGVFLAATGEPVGEGGVHALASAACGWPEIGYKFRREFWGRGYATEFLAALLDAWRKLPRSKARVRVARESVPDEGDGAAEQVSAVVDVLNMGSRRVLEKRGFVSFAEWTGPDTQEHRLGQPVTLVGYRRMMKC